MSGPDGSEPAYKCTCPLGVGLASCPQHGWAEQKHFSGIGTPPRTFVVSPELAERAKRVLDSAYDPKTERIAFLERKREATKADLLLKFEDADYHGVADAAMDLRDIESELKGLAY